MSKFDTMTDADLHAHGVAMSTATRKCNTSSCPCTLTYWDRVLEPKVGKERYQIFLDGWTYGASGEEEYAWASTNPTFLAREEAWNTVEEIVLNPTDHPEEYLKATLARLENEAAERKLAVEELGYDEGDYVRLPKGKATFKVTAIIGEVVTYTEIGGRWNMVRTGEEAKRYVKVEGL